MQVLRGRSILHSACPHRLFTAVQVDDGMVVDAEVFLALRYGYDVRIELVCEKARSL
jgi:hypothetical protein